jgi:hypothetical protein
MFNRHPRLPVDLVFSIPREGKDDQSYHDYVKSVKKRLEYAYGVASSSISGSQREQKKKFDLKVRGAVVEVGDRVLVRNVGLRGKQKIADRWAPDPYVVVCQPNNDIPVYVVHKENGKGNARTLHRNMLLPLSSVPPAHLVDKEKPREVPNRHSTGAEAGTQREEGQGGLVAEVSTPTEPTTTDQDSPDSSQTVETSDNIEIMPRTQVQDPPDPDEVSRDGTNESVSGDGSDWEDDESLSARPQRTCRAPAWLRDSAWEYMAQATAPGKRRGSRKKLIKAFSHKVVEGFITQIAREIPNIVEEVAPGVRARLQMVIDD